jgi:predicted Fe-Mo cluster-binding NifX family protein
MKVTHRIALTTRDGKVVTEHFGHARWFHIVDFDDEGYRYVESREIEPRCTGDAPDQQAHGAAKFAPVIELLEDCDAVVTAQIGPGAADYVIHHGLRVLEARGLVSDILDELISTRILDGE